MATKTKNYNLIKPDLTDDADIRVINGNMDVLDNQLKSISDKAGTATNNAYTNITVSPDYTWKFTKGSGENESHDTIKTATTVHTTTGTARITTTDGTNENAFEVSSGGGGSQFNFNGLTTYMNSNNDYFRLGGDNAYFRFGKDKQLYCNTERINLSRTTLMSTDTDLFKVGEGNDPWFAINKQYNKLFYSPQGINSGYEIPYATTPLSFSGTQARGESHEGYIKYDNGLLIQWGCITYSGTDTWNYTVNLPLPYANTGYVTMITLAFPTNTHSVNMGNRDIVYNQSESAIGVWSDNNNVVYWMTIGQGA